MGINATQANMAGTGIGTFSDRGRDVVRGGGAHDRGEALIRNQGFINGLWYDKNGSSAVPAKERFQQLLEAGDLVKLALAATVRDYEFINCRGQVVKGAELKYNNQPAGYSKDPPDVINYISAHDNQTLFDINQYKIPMETTMSDRVRINNLGVALVGLAQGIPFFHAGDDMHPVLSRSIADPIVRDSRYHEATGTFVIPPRTTAVFVEKRFWQEALGVRLELARKSPENIWLIWH